MSTSVKLNFPGGATVYVQGYANASYIQNIAIQPPSGGHAVFSGNGENNTLLALATTGFLTPNSGGQPSFVVPGGGGGYTVSVNANGAASNVTGNTSTFNTPEGGQIIMAWASSEDAGDEDWNDSLLIFTAYLPPS